MTLDALIAAALRKQKARTINELCERLGIDAHNLYAAKAGRRQLSDRTRMILLRCAGLDTDTIFRQIVGETAECIFLFNFARVFRGKRPGKALGFT